MPPPPDGAAARPSPGALRAPLAGTVVEVLVVAGETVAEGAIVLVLESMKMEHEVHADRGGRVDDVRVRAGDNVAEGEPLLTVQRQDGAITATGADGARATAAAGTTVMSAPAEPASTSASSSPIAEVTLRPDLRELRDREALLADGARPEAIGRRHALGLRSARENIDALCDDGSFIEYGALAFAAQERRRSRDELIRDTPADGMVTGIGGVNAALFGAERARTVVMAYDATVLAGTQGMRNHQKTDRLLGIARAQGLPVVLFAEGGGGRPGDVDMPVVAGLHVPTFARFAGLSGKVPLVAVVAGRCFAGNAALAGCCDAIIATSGSSIGMGGPAMVEGGGLGTFAPEAIGPSAVQSGSGVIDVLVADEAAAVAAARHYLSFFQGVCSGWTCSDGNALRDVLPASRLRVYDMRCVMRGVVDTGSLLELRAGFGAGVLTALARLEGRPIGVLASNPAHLGGAIDADAADKAARFMQLCDAHGLAMLSLIDTPGFMVGPEIEKRAQVRHASRMFAVGAQLTVPFVALVVRKAYGLGAMAMAAGGLHAPLATVAWPSGEFGAMGLEGAVELGYRKELAAVAPGPEREALRERLVAEQYARGQALNMAATLEIDAVIDPARTRDWIGKTLAASPASRGSGRFVDPW